MAKKKKKPVPMKSRKSGIKNAKRIAENHKVIKSIIG
jgi:hypothetical protein